MQYEPGCYTCERMARVDAPAWDRILRTPYWTLVHAYNTRLPGWLVLVANRNFISFPARRISRTIGAARASSTR